MDSVWGDWWLIPVSVVAALILVWLSLATALWLLKPDELGIADLFRLLLGHPGGGPRCSRSPLARDTRGAGGAAQAVRAARP